MKKLSKIYAICADFVKKHYYFSYSLMFLLTAAVVFQSFYLNGKTFIWQPDGMDQHYRALLYYSQWLRTAAKTILADHSFSIPTYSFSIGYGSDILDTLHYYVIGDPFSLGSALFPEHMMVNYYCAMILVRLYFAGITFSMFCFYVGKRERKNGFSGFAVLSGALVYVFCGYGIYSSIRHPYFANPMIYLPLLLLGIEKIFDKKRSRLFVFSVFLASISNFYFLYMLAIISVLYVIWRLFSVYTLARWREMCEAMIRLILSALLGAAMSAVLLLPVIMTFLHSSRLESAYSFDRFYERGAYERIFGLFLSPSVETLHWTLLGFAAIGLLAVMLLFIQKGHTNLKIAFIGMSIMVLLPVVGRMMNGFSYPSNRWTWAIACFISYVVVLKWEAFFSLCKRDKLFLLGGMLLYGALLAVFPRSNTPDSIFALICGYISLALLIFVPETFCRKIVPSLIFVCLFVNLGGNAYYLYVAGSYRKDFVSYKELDDNMNKTEADAIKTVTAGDNEFSRYQAMHNHNNCTLHSGLHSIQYYWSLENRNISDYRSEMGFCGSIMVQAYGSDDSRAVPLTLANVKYTVQDGDAPYGFEKRTVTDDYTIWENPHFLPFGYTYSSAIDDEVYETLSPLEKQEAMLQGCVLKNPVRKSSLITPAFTASSPTYGVKAGEHVSITDGTIRVTRKKSNMTLTFDGLADTETYLLITGLNFKDILPRDRYTQKEWDKLSEEAQKNVLYRQKYHNKLKTTIITCTARNKTDKETTAKLTYYTPRYSWYSNRKDFLVNLGYDASGKKSVTLQFKNSGEYRFDDIKILCQPRSSYAAQIDALRENTLTQVDFHDANVAYATNTITGSIHLDDAKYLLLTIPYGDGWSAFVDGEKQEILQANTMYMALDLTAGDHEIRLTYHTPGLLAGLIISAVSIITGIIFMIYRNTHTYGR